MDAGPFLPVSLFLITYSSSAEREDDERKNDRQKSLGGGSFSHGQRTYTICTEATEQRVAESTLFLPVPKFPRSRAPPCVLVRRHAHDTLSSLLWHLWRLDPRSRHYRALSLSLSWPLSGRERQESEQRASHSLYDHPIATQRAWGSYLYLTGCVIA